MGSGALAQILRAHPLRPPPAELEARGPHIIILFSIYTAARGGGQRGKKLTSPASFFATRVTYEEREWQKSYTKRDARAQKVSRRRRGRITRPFTLGSEAERGNLI